jgi:hypothetical protein
MAVTKIRKISSWTLLIVASISVIVFGLFYFGGESEPVGGDQFKNPTYTGELLYWMYILFAISALSLIAFGVLQFANKFKHDPKSSLISLGVLVTFVVLLVIAYAMGNGSPLPRINPDSQKYNVESWLKITDMWLYCMYILSVLCICAMVWGAVKTLMKK